MACQEHAAEFRPHEKELAELGIQLVFVGTGRPDQAAYFRERIGLDAPIWVDPERATYRHLGFRRSLTSTWGPLAALGYARALAKGFRQRSVKGDVLQQGGVLIVARGGAPVYCYASLASGDMPPMEEILRHARKAARR